MKVLLIEDNHHVREGLRLVLEEHGHVVTPANNGDEAIQLLDVERYEVVISDVVMPDRDGFEVVDYIRHMSDRPKVIMISGGGNRLPAEMIIPYAETIADAVLMKPFSNEQLLSAIDRAAA